MTKVKPMNAFFMTNQFLPNLPCQLNAQQLEMITEALNKYEKTCEDAATKLEEALLAILPHTET
jgi:hypothetical protein